VGARLWKRASQEGRRRAERRHLSEPKGDYPFEYLKARIPKRKGVLAVITRKWFKRGEGAIRKGKRENREKRLRVSANQYRGEGIQRYLGVGTGSKPRGKGDGVGKKKRNSHKEGPKRPRP